MARPIHFKISTDNDDMLDEAVRILEQLQDANLESVTAGVGMAQVFTQIEIAKSLRVLSERSTPKDTGNGHR